MQSFIQHIMKKRLFSFYFLLLLVVGIALCSCSSDLSEDLSTGSIAGSVSDATTGEPVPTVNVILTPGGNATVTGSDGSFYFQNLEPGTYTLSISKENYKTNTSTLIVKSGEPTNAHLLIDRIPSTLTADKTELDFGENISTLSFTIVNSGYTDIKYQVETGNCNWLTVEPDKDVLNYGKTATIVVKVLRDILPPGNNQANIVVKSLSGDGNVEVKVFAVNNSGASVNTLDVTNILNTEATLNGEITNPGKPPYTERGFIIDTQSTPTIENCLNKFSSPVTSDPKYSVKISGLSPVKTYYARAYMIQNKSVVYGNIVSFSTTKQETTLNTSAVTNITATSATLNGSILNEGQPAYSEKGFCYGKNSTPTISNNRRVVSGVGSGTFSLNVTNLEFPQTYYVRTYAIQDGKTIYGNVVSFKTNYDETGVRTSAATQITYNSAVLNGTITSAGSPQYSAKGFCYAENNYIPTINDIKIEVSGSVTGNFQTTVKNLKPNNRYYFRAFAMQNGKPVYGEILNFQCSYEKASVSTSAATNIGYTTATFNGSVLSVGQPPITERGFCYSLSYYDTPTISHNKTIASGSGPGNFKCDVKNLEEDTRYYVRAYVIQEGEARYGQIVEFTTGYAPYVVTGPYDVTPSDGYFYQAFIQGAFIDGNPSVTEYGFVYSNSSSPTVANGTKVQGQNISHKSDGAYYYTRTLTNLQPNKTYYYRAYVKTSQGYVYGETESFSTY